MSRFAIKYPFFIIMLCLVILVVGTTMTARMPVDLFPEIKIPVVVVATFYSGMPPEQIETDITGRFERFFTLGSGIDHMESRSLPGVSLIKVYFQPGTDPNAAVSTISNLAMADLRKLPPGTLPPVILKFDASSLPVCLITLKGAGLNETQLRDIGQYNVRNQVANVPGASVPQPFGGKYRQIQVYVDPVKLQAAQLSVMDVVRTVNNSNMILPAGDVRIGPKDFNLYTNSQLPDIEEINRLPLKTVGNASLLVGDVGHAQDAAQIQTSMVRVDGQKSVYLPVLKQGGDSNTIAIVDGVEKSLKDLVDVPKSLTAKVVFDQSVYVKTAIRNLINEGGIGLVLTALMILIFLGSVRGTVAVMLSIPLSALAAFLAINASGGTINTMVLGGLALAFSRLIDNSVVVLENIFRHLENGEPAEIAAERGGREVALPVLAATFTTTIVFFPVVFLYGVSRFLFTALAAAVVFSLFASYMVAMTVVPLFCAQFIKNAHNEAGHVGAHANWFSRFVGKFNHAYNRMLMRYDIAVGKTLLRPIATTISILGVCAFSLAIYPLLGVSFFPRTDPGQFVLNLKAPTGTRLELTDAYAQRVEKDIREIVPNDDLGMVVSNIGVTPGFSSMYTSNSGQHTATIQVSLKEGHKVGSYEYMRRVRHKLADDLPELSTYLQSGGLVDAVINLGLPAPIDIQVSSNHLHDAYNVAQELQGKIAKERGVSDVLIPQDLDYPALKLNVNREMASRLGLNSREVVDNVITALTSNQMIAPSFWVDPRSGNDYMLTVQYPDSQVKSLNDLKQIPLRSDHGEETTQLGAVTDVKVVDSPTEVDHYQLRRVIDIYVAPSGQDLGSLATRVNKIIAETKAPEGVRVTMRGSVEGMNQSFKSFGLGLILSIVLVYLILMAQFASFLDPFIILLAIPPGITGVLLFLWATRTTLNVMSLMGVIMMTGIVVSNSILIVDVARELRKTGMPIAEAVATACRMRLRPVLMTSLATILGMIPMALALEAGSEQYAPLARAIIGGLTLSVIVTVFLVPAAYLWLHRREERPVVQA
ncbi:acriflavin resistance protein [Candidatus Koribacter versatilis Ellin345]|uniref:Acriflavin resistance protein n=1 Tax=Koribacter versatilis (strain Ellin345) TaxID=204669 RepID=Q1IR00_KORVE|nr:efflux RND transporter permease subunit [Candidatus Koribacter versatilis]ABF40700.1 acriflavin resistance protein [Candidatus Koribacter versatilis Ellin345]